MMSEKKTKLKPPRRSSDVSDSSTSSESTSSFSSDDEETDLRDLKPIKEYLNDRRELATQLFKSVKVEKIRMMLPQILKKMNFYDLEELCGSELSGMSRKRILSIINGQRMMESSDTDETDDSGPSLEIISDTEEWLTDDEIVIKEEDSSSTKLKSKKNADKSKGKSRHISKDKIKSKAGKDSKSSDVIIKVEDQKPKPKEGESLLDLLELEMRARAIRALIRKEEDIIPGKITSGSSSEKNGTKLTASANSPVNKYVVKEMQQMSVSLKQGSGLDDDVMLVIHPAPTIELLSSDSENEKGKEKESVPVSQGLGDKNENGEKKEEENKRINKKLESECENEKEEQSKRVNKRLENERGTETTHSTSTIGDDPLEVEDNLIKKEVQLPCDNERNKTDHVIKVSEKVQKFLDKETDKVMNKLPDEINKASDKISDRSPDKRAENTLHETSDEQVGMNKIYEQESIEVKEAEKVEEESEKLENEPKIIANISEDSPTKQKTPDKELEEGELTSSDNDSNVERATKKVDIEELSSTEKAKKGSHRRLKVRENSEENEILDQNENTGSGSETSYKVKDSLKVKSKSRKKIRDKMRVTRRSTSEVNENLKEEDKTPESAERPVRKIQIELREQKEEPRKQSESEMKQEDADKVDMEEIIDLDDYPDDMDDLEGNEQGKSSDPQKSADNNKSEKSEPAETWASRYYNTDDVQNVIKDSKIQSEIRKRLRERQRLCKLNNSPNANTAGSNSTVDIKVEEAKQKPLGSVEEYLALKAATAAAAAASANAKIEIYPEKSQHFGSKRDSLQRRKSRISRKRSKSDKRSAKDDVTSGSLRKQNTIFERSDGSRPD